MELKTHITDERTGIGYTLCGDYYLPDLALSEQEYYDLGRFGRAKFGYLQKCHKVLFVNLMTDGTRNDYLHSVDVALVKEYEDKFYFLSRYFIKKPRSAKS